MEEHILSPREVCRLFARTDRLHRAAFERGVSEIGVHRSQHFLLMRLSRLGGTASQRMLADELMVSAAAIAVSVRKLEAGGYITKAGSEQDGRRNEIGLTDKGRAVVEHSRAYFESVDDAMCEGISREELTAFARCLEKMHKNLLELEENA